ncbi:hypothetical protein [Aquimarina latercula]|uniref:hypothetical protein n=1 Tax=Aquimarina latercula TaxID=987 RepID=UPI000423947D|nr:hypothetical protein [Aquimarina latercula]
MKTAAHVLKTYFETGDVPTQNQFENLIDSFHHKDDGAIITKISVSTTGTVQFDFTDGSTVVIEKYNPPSERPISFITDLQSLLDQMNQKLNLKVDQEEGKGLSQANFTQAEKEKLASLENYIPPSERPISFIAGLVSILDQMAQDITLKVAKEDGKGLSEANFTQEEKEKLAGLEQQPPQSVESYDRFRYINTIDDDFTNAEEVLDALSVIVQYYLVRTPNGSVYFICKLGSLSIDDLDKCRVELIRDIGRITNIPRERNWQLSDAKYEVWNFPATGISENTFEHNALYHFNFWRLKNPSFES